VGLLTHEVSISQTHLAGAEAEVDFGEFYPTIAGVVVKCSLPRSPQERARCAKQRWNVELAEDNVRYLDLARDIAYEANTTEDVVERQLCRSSETA
jgi:hypothetical protein